MCVLFLSFSPLWTAAWVTFNEAEASTGLVSCCNLTFLGMFHVIISLSFSIHIPLVSSLLFTPYELEIKSNWVSPIFRARPHARQWSFTGGHSCFTFPISFSNSFEKIASSWCVRVGDGIRSCALPKECCPFFPKTTVSWLVLLSFD